MLAKNFLSTHPKKGQPTNFVEKVRSGQKKHTIRTNFKYWNRIIKDVNAGVGVLIVKQWSGRPYHTEPIPIFTVTKARIESVEFQKSTPVNKHRRTFIKIGDEMNTGVAFDNVARNDGFDLVDDFIDWFPNELKDACMIYFDEIVWEC